MELPRRRFGGVDRAAAERAIDDQRRIVAELTQHLARVEGQLATAKAERDEANALLQEMQRDIADVLRLATRAALDTEEETETRITEAKELAQKQVDDLAIEAATAAETAAALADALQRAVDIYRSMQPIRIVEPTPEAHDAELSGGSAPSTGVDAPQSEAIATPLVAAPEEPFVLEEDVVVEEAEPPTPTPAEQPPTYTTVLAAPLPSPAMAADVEQRLVEVPGVREVTLHRLTSTEAEFVVAHDPGGLDLTPLLAVGIPVSARPAEG